MSKHAYLIEAHNNIAQLEKLLHCLDFVDNDIFLHIDAKSEILKDINNIKLKYSKLVIMPSQIVYWGGYSQIEVEMRLIKKAMDTYNYDRLHLISGADLPLVSQKEMHKFFDKHIDTEFIHFDYVNDPKTYKQRMAQYHFLRNKIDRKQRVLCYIEKASIIFQRMIGINRLRNIKFELHKGANWFSITGNCAKYVLDNILWIEKTFKYTKCCDEVFIQTLVYNSEFKKNLFYDSVEKRFGNLRFTDWKRGNPYTFTNVDYELLTSNHYMFARKFDENKDNEIINKIVKKITYEREF